MAADSEEIADGGSGKIKVSYEVLPFVLDEREAMNDGAPIIHDESDAVGIHDASRNVVHHILAATVNDVALEAAFAFADKVYEHTYRVHQVQQCPIEPHVTVGWLDEDDRLVLRTATQVPFHTPADGRSPARATVKDVRVIKPRIGGGFGAKQEMLIEDIVGHLVLKATSRSARALAPGGVRVVAHAASRRRSTTAPASTRMASSSRRRCG